MASKFLIGVDAAMMLIIFAFSGFIFLGLGIQSRLLVYGTGAVLIAITIAFALRNARTLRGVEGGADSEKTRDTLHRLFLLLYVQYAYYWGTFAAGMFTNYYFAVPGSLQPTLVQIVTEVIMAPDLFTHVLMAILSTSMSIPVIYLARRIRLRDVTRLHVAAICVRIVGFFMGPLYIYYNTSPVSIVFSGSVASLTMVSVFGVAVFLTLLSRIFIVREDVRLKSMAVARPTVSVPLRGSDS
ncbi:MAG: hypothetical protein JRM85_09335 [Nitrososphaerota archaeon]|jgi:hypothetical protein|nr:hypothetical protein [Nitrososphaerota archaeon]